MNPGSGSAGASWLISVGAGRWQLGGIRAAQNAGILVFALDGDSSAPGLAVADHKAVVDIRDVDAVLAAVAASEIKPAGAVAFVTDAGMRAVGALRDQYGLPGPGEKVLTALVDKPTQRAIWKNAGLPNPREWRVLNSLREAQEVLSALERPVVVKPADSAGSRAVTRLERDADGQKVHIALAEAFAASTSGRIIVESVLHGREYTVETFADKGATHVLAITVKRKVAGTGDTVASELATPDESPAVLTRISDTAVAALAAVGYGDGPGHTEIMFDPTVGPGLIEAAGRGAGFMVFEGLVPATSGFDIATATALQAVGKPVPRVPSARQDALLRFFPSRPGRVRGFSGFAAANKVSGVTAEPFVQAGEKIGQVRGDADRLGYILARGKTPAEARERADAAESLISFDIEAL